MLIRVIGEMEQPAIIIMTAFVTAILTAVAARYVKLVPGVLNTHTRTRRIYTGLLDHSNTVDLEIDRLTDLPLLKQPDHMFYAIAWDCIDSDGALNRMYIDM